MIRYNNKNKNVPLKCVPFKGNGVFAGIVHSWTKKWIVYHQIKKWKLRLNDLLISKEYMKKIYHPVHCCE